MKKPFDQFKLSDSVIDEIGDSDLLQKKLNDGASAGYLCGFSNEAMALLYRTACTLIDEKRYDEASNSFLFLAALEPYCQPYWLGLGMAYQLVGNFEAAVDAYEIAATNQLNNPIPYFYLAKCLYAMHERSSARQALDLAIEYADENPDFQELKRQALEVRERL